MLTITTIHAYTDEDTYANGCAGNGTYNRYDMRMKAKDKAGIIQAYADHLDVMSHEIDIDECDSSCLLVQRTETGDGYKASDADIEAWKVGNKRLWLATYTAHVDIVTPADLS